MNEQTPVRAYTLGRYAYRAGYRYSDNPFLCNEQYDQEWARGFLDEQHVQAIASGSGPSVGELLERMRQEV